VKNAGVKLVIVGASLLILGTLHSEADVVEKFINLALGWVCLILGSFID